MFFRKLAAAAVAGGLFLFPRIAISSGPPPTIQPVEDLRLLVALVQFQGEDTPTLSRAAVVSLIGEELEGFLRENSYGRVGVEGSVIDWVPLPLTPTCDITPVRQATIAALDPVVDWRDFDHLIVVASYTGGSSRPYCGWSGLASGTIVATTDDGTISIRHAAVHSSAVNLAVMAHELGHNLGLGHANFLDCGFQSWALTGCSVLPYADYYSVMGRSTPARDLNAYERDLLGWYDLSRPLVTVTVSGTFSLSPIESLGGGVKALKIPRPNGQPLYVEYRQPIGFDVGLDRNGFSDVFQGALLHVPRMRGHESLIIDPTPPGEPHRAALPVGRSFTDPLTGIVVLAAGRQPETLSITVTFPKTPTHRERQAVMSW